MVESTTEIIKKKQEEDDLQKQI
jgi:glycylpeptide N-tetradecanoyltransferase